ncbi:SagB/ThcOx family dehydrogenase [Candidatus Fermentibacterales bacterium]|nr:SagB/ThcOx family dehydrogenase [Candidatus Fermentibacterales bacterium]
MKSIEEGREFLRATAWEDTSGLESDQSRSIPHPPQQKPIPEGADLVGLPSPDGASVVRSDIARVMGARRSRREFLDRPVSLEQLSFLLWATQGMKRLVGGGAASLRTVPSAGARHPFETYLHVRAVEGLDPPGVYRYLPVEHCLYLVREGDRGPELTRGCLGQSFAGTCPVCFIWSAVPYRTEWRYSVLSPKIIAIDSGHVCQNLYLAAEALGLGTCAIAAYHQTLMDRLVGLDGRDEFVIYVAPAGWPVRREGDE